MTRANAKTSPAWVYRIRLSFKDQTAFSVSLRALVWAAIVAAFYGLFHLPVCIPEILLHGITH